MGYYITLHLEETELLKTLKEHEIFLKIADILEENGFRVQGCIALTPFISRDFKSMNKAIKIHKKNTDMKW